MNRSSQATHERVRVSLELVPRSLEALERELALARDKLPGVTMVNVPDLLRFELRSYHACAAAKRHYPQAVPHLRAIDFNLLGPLKLARFLDEHGLGEVLVVNGDAPADMSRTVYPTSSVQLIRRLRLELPDLRIYAALDPYRQSFVKERDYAHEKLDAGADGFFTQPFFDLRLMAVYRELLSGVEIFWGVTPVTSERSLGYWQGRNKAIFPQNFEPTLAWNVAFAEAALDFVREQGGHIYFMPIRTDPVRYLERVLGRPQAKPKVTSNKAQPTALR